MLDEFPTLEVAATVLAAVFWLRVTLLARSRSALERAQAELRPLFARGDLAEATRVASASAAHGFGDLAEELAGALSAEAGATLEALLGEELSQYRERAESSRARDLVLLAVLFSAVVYAAGSGSASRWLLGAAALGLVALVVGFVLRGRLAARTLEALSELRDAAQKTARPSSLPPPPRDVCPQCGESLTIHVTDPSRLVAGLAALSPVVVAICRACGTLRGQVEDPRAIPIGPEHGTALSGGTGPIEEASFSDAEEHEG